MLQAPAQGISSSVVFTSKKNNIKQGKNDVMRSAKMLIEGSAISKDVILMFDEMYLK